VFAVVPFRQGAVDLEELEAGYPQTAALETAENFHRQAALDAIWLDQDESSFQGFPFHGTALGRRRGV
jgi:hypothetical protein